MDCKFVVGQNVVCVGNGEWWNPKEEGLFQGSQKGDVVTIRKIRGADCGNEIVVELFEWPPSCFAGVAMGFGHRSFRPLNEAKGDTVAAVEKLKRDALDRKIELPESEDAWCAPSRLTRNPLITFAHKSHNLDPVIKVCMDCVTGQDCELSGCSFLLFRPSHLLNRLTRQMEQAFTRS